MSWWIACRSRHPCQMSVGARAQRQGASQKCLDANGSYFVPLHNAVPLLWHRDS